MAEQASASETQKAVKEHDPIKSLIDQGKESGFLTYEEINRRLPEGVIGAEKTPEEEIPLPDLGVETTNSIRMYLTEMGKVPLLTREQELTLTRNIKENEKTLKLIVLENPITLRELRNWESLLAQQEMTPKELMPRGRKTNQELARMRQKMKNVVKFIITAEERMSRAEDRLKKKNITPHVRASLQEKVQKE